MLKPMKPQTGMPRNLFLWILVGLLVISGVVALVSAFGGEDAGEDEVNAVYTSAAATVAAQQQALLLASPTATVAGTPTATATFLALPTASPTLFTQASIPTTSSGSSGGGSGAVGCNNSVFVSDVTYPDNTVVTPGQAIKKTWKLQNTGSCAWTPTYKVTFISGNAMGGVATAIGITVAPGASGDVTVDMTAPSAAGEVIGYWILTNDSGQNFGSNFYVQVKVGGTVTGTPATSTPGTTTPTVTATSATTPPSSANNPTVTLTCTSDGGVTPQYKFSGTLAWEDLSSNETGFRIYINGVVVNTTSENVTTFAIPESAYMPAGTPLVFGVEAFNAAGSASTATVSSQCP